MEKNHMNDNLSAAIKALSDAISSGVDVSVSITISSRSSEAGGDMPSDANAARIKSNILRLVSENGVMTIGILKNRVRGATDELIDELLQDGLLVAADVGRSIALSIPQR